MVTLDPRFRHAHPIAKKPRLRIELDESIAIQCDLAHDWDKHRFSAMGTKSRAPGLIIAQTNESLRFVAAPRFYSPACRGHLRVSGVVLRLWVLEVEHPFAHRQGALGD